MTTILSLGDVMLSGFNDEELQDELDRRKKERRNAPQLIDDPDISKLQEVCQLYINAFTNKDDDGDFIDAPHRFEHYVFEGAIEAFFGKDVFDWINEQY